MRKIFGKISMVLAMISILMSWLSYVIDNPYDYIIFFISIITLIISFIGIIVFNENGKEFVKKLLDYF